MEVTPPAEPGSRSTERDTQLERERRILQAIYFTRDSIPFSPEEPDKEDFVKQEPIEIPMKDVCLTGGFFCTQFFFIFSQSFFPANNKTLQIVSKKRYYHTDGIGLSQMRGYPSCQSLRGNEFSYSGMLVFMTL